MTPDPSCTLLLAGFNNLAHAPRGTPCKKSIVTVALDENTGEMKANEADAIDGLNNAAFIRHHPSQDIIYVATECIDGHGDVLAFKTDRSTGKLAPYGGQSAQGASTCFLTVTANQQHLLFVNYWDSTLGVMPLDENGVLSPACAVQPPPAPVRAQCIEDHLANRQSEPHAHCIVVEPYFGRVVLVPDLGTDEVRQYVFDAERGDLTPVGKIDCAPRELGPHGPRYIEFDPIADAAYVVNELSSTVSIFRFDRAAAARLAEAVDRDGPSLAPRDVQVLEFIGLVTTRPTDPPKHRNTCGRICVDPSGQYVLVSNRGDDTVSSFRIERDGATVTGLTPWQIESTRGCTPRHFQFSPSGKWLIAANQDSDNCASFAWDSTNGTLTFSGYTVPVGSPNFVAGMPEEATLIKQRQGIKLRAPISQSTSAEF